MKLANKQIFFISLLLSLCMFFAPLAQDLYAESLFSKLKTKVGEFVNKTVEKYTSKDFWIDKTTDAITSKVMAPPVKLATAALGIAVGTAIGGPVGATLGAYLGNKIGGHLCSIVGKPVVKGLINEKINNGEKITPSTIFKVIKNLDGPSMACNVTGAVVGDVIGAAIGGIAGAAITACVGGGTILPIIGTITFAKLGSKYGQKFGNWIGKKIGERAFNNTYKALTGIDRTEDQSAGKSILLSTAEDIASVNKEELARTTTGEVVGDVIGSAIGTIAGATLSAVTTGGTSTKMADIGEKWGSKVGTSIGKWIGTTFFDKSKEVIDSTKNKKQSNQDSTTVTISNSNTGIVTISDNMPVSANQTALSPSVPQYNIDEANAVYEAYKISFENYAKALADSNTSNEYRLQKEKEYSACYEMYKKIISGEFSK